MSFFWGDIPICMTMGCCSVKQMSLKYFAMSHSTFLFAYEVLVFLVVSSL